MDEPRRFLKHCFLLGVSVVFGMIAHTSAAQVSYSKDFVVEGAEAGASIFAGGLVETWAGNDIEPKEKITFGFNAFREYKHAKPTLTSSGDINGATRNLVLKDTTKKVAFNPPNLTTLYEGHKETTDEPDHKAPNKADAHIVVNSQFPGNIKVRDPQGGKDLIKRPIGASVVSFIVGSATAGKPDGASDKDKYHSANSFASTYIKGGKVFVADAGPGPATGFTLFGRDSPAVAGTPADQDSKKSDVLDPYFATVTDLDTGDSITQELMRQEVHSQAAVFGIDDTGIRLIIDRFNPASFVDLFFSTNFPWVLNPYSYGARLDSSGLHVTGLALPFADWVVTTNTDTVEAFFAYGPDGQPYESADVQPPSSLFTPGHSYSYSYGAADGAVDIASVPEGGSIGMILAGGVPLLAVMKRRRTPRA